MSCSTDAVVFHPQFTPSQSPGSEKTILCSSDGVHYSVASFILRDTTTFFRDLLNCNMPISLTAPSSVLTPLMLMLSGLPVTLPLPFPDLEEAVVQLTMWGAPGPLMILQGSVTAYAILPANSNTSLVIQLYGLAMRMGWQAEAEFMAGHALELDVWDDNFAQDLSILGSSALLRLVKIRRERRDQLVEGLRRISSCTTRLPTETHPCNSSDTEACMEKLYTRIFWEMDKHPSGKTLLRALVADDWSEATRCWKLQCSGCGKKLYDKMLFVKEIQTELDKLTVL